MSTEASQQSATDHIRALHNERNNFARTHMAALAWRDALVAVEPRGQVIFTSREVIDRLNQILGATPPMA